MWKWLDDDWKKTASKARSMWIAYAGILYGCLMQFPDAAQYLQAIANETGWGTQAAKWIAIACAIVGIVRVSRQKNME